MSDLLATRHGLEAHMLVPAWSNCPCRMTWVVRSDTLAAFHQSLGKVLADAKYVSLVKQLSEHVEGQFSRDAAYKEIPTSVTGKPAGRFATVRTIHFRNVGAMGAAMPACREMCEHVFKTCGSHLTLHVPVASGPISRAIIVDPFEDPDVPQATEETLMGDEKFRHLLQSLSEHVDGAKTEDELWCAV